MQKDARYLTIDPHDPAQNTWLLGMGSMGNGLRVGTAFNVGDVSPVNEKSTLFLYPNPTSGEIRLLCKHTLTLFLLTDQAGRIVCRINNPEEGNAINLNYLSKGVYFYQANDGSREWQGKIIVK